MFSNLTHDLQEIILHYISNHYLKLFRLMCKTTRDMSNGRFIAFIQLPVYKHKDIYDPEVNYKYWFAVSTPALTLRGDILRYIKTPHNISYTPNDEWFNYIINNMRIPKFHLINKPDTTHSISDTKPVFLGKKPHTPLNNYKEWKKNQRGLPHSISLRRGEINKWTLEDGFDPRIYDESIPWFNYIQINMTVK